MSRLDTVNEAIVHSCVMYRYLIIWNQRPITKKEGKDKSYLFAIASPL